MTRKSTKLQPGRTAWRAHTYFNLYRFLVAFLFVSLDWIGQLPQPLGIYDKLLFSLSAHLYLFVALATYFFIHIQKPPLIIQVISNVFLDVIIITLMMYASAGLNSGFGMLLIITVAGGSILNPGKMGILFASVATIAVLSHEVYAQLQQILDKPNYTHAGILGITFFVTAIISSALARRVEVSEALAEQRAIELESLARLNEHIVQRLQSGIIVIDNELNIRLLNESAKRLLNIKKDYRDKPITHYLPELANHLNDWKERRIMNAITMRIGVSGIDVQVSFSQLNPGRKLDILVFLEEVSIIRQRAQQMKLASLGRLTASIAHEIRNPLGAISHAGQLLSESGSLEQQDKRLTAIIEEHSRRMNNIIENVMSISRREQSVPTEVELERWLHEFIEEFRSRHGLSADAVKLIINSNNIHARMDSGQLHQVLWNLCENGLRYSRNSPLLVLKCAIQQDSYRPFIDIIDTGPGISTEVEEQLFEPFFTTNSDGTGLGLYIARELCEANQATLNLYMNSENGCTFRINFSHPEKQHNIV